MKKWNVVGSPMMKQGSYEYRDKDGTGDLKGRIELNQGGTWRAFISRWERVKTFKSFDKAREYIERYYAKV